jgi:hypothetical protein
MSRDQLRNKLLLAVQSHALGHIDKHIANIEVLAQNPVGIGEHQDIIHAIEEELDHIAKYNDQVEMLEKFFQI